MDEHTKYRRNQRILFSELGNDVVALSIEDGNCFSMEDVTATVWKALSEPIDLATLCARIKTDYEVDDVTCRADVSELLDEMLQQGLIEPA